VRTRRFHAGFESKHLDLRRVGSDETEVGRVSSLKEMERPPTLPHLLIAA